MRQAGRYLPEYRCLRKRFSFLEICKTPELSCEVTLLPFRYLPLDAAIIFADILLLTEALGYPFHFSDTKGIVFEKRLEKLEDLKMLPKETLSSSFDFLVQAISLAKRELTVPLLGFSGGPFTLLSYLLEGGSSSTFERTKQAMKEQPCLVHAFLERLTLEIIDYLKLQIQAGVEALQLFETWAQILTREQLKEFCLPYLKKIQKAIHPFPLIFFAKGVSEHYSLYLELEPRALSLDDKGDLAVLRKAIPQNIALQGNFSPQLFLGDKKKKIQEEVITLFERLEDKKGYIVNLGHGILPHTPISNLKCLIETVHMISPS